MLDEVLLLKSNPHYRIGDLIFRQGNRWLEDREEILKNKKYKNSFLYNYLSNLNDPLYDPYFDINNTIPRNVDNEDLLYSIINDNKPENIRDKTLYIHVRAGDIVQQDYGDLMSMWLMNQDSLIRKVAEVITNSSGINRISVITAFHFGDFKSRSKWIYDRESEILNKELLSNLISRLEKLKTTNILQKSSCNISSIDKHFFYLCHGLNVILDTSGMSQVAFRFRQSKLLIGAIR